MPKYRHEIRLYTGAGAAYNTVDEALGETLISVKSSINALGECVVLIHKAIEQVPGLMKPRMLLLDELKRNHS